VDVLAHPGLIELEDARLASERGVFLEVSARRGHSLANGHVVRMATAAGALMVLDSDAHAPEDLLTAELAQKVALGAGLDSDEAGLLLRSNPERLLGRLGVSLVPATGR
jgi:histidinol phosphatase-like PHP family hydrolase